MVVGLTKYFNSPCFNKFFKAFKGCWCILFKLFKKGS